MFTRSSYAVPDPVTSYFHTRKHPVRIGFFTERDSGAHSGLAATVEALTAYRPQDATIYQYSAPSNLAALLHTGELMRRAEADRIDVVHLGTSGPVAIGAMLVAARFGLPVLASFPAPTQAATATCLTYMRTLVRQVRRVLVTSLVARNAFMRAGVKGGKMIIWNPGVDTTVFAPSMRSDIRRERWGVSAARPAVIYAGALSDDRGAQLLRSMEVALHRTRPMHQLIVAGDGPMRSEMQARCPNAIFLGVVPRAEMPEVLASADVYVCPSEASSTNLAVLEAQASGLPVVVMERGSARERVGERSAIICRAPADFIVETAALVRTDARRRAMRIAAREHALLQEWAPGLTSVYAEYRAAAELSRLRRDFEPAFISQGRRF